MVDSEGRIVCVTRVDHVEIRPLASVDDRHARREGEGFRDVAHWRTEHERYWSSTAYLDAVGRPGIAVNDGTPVVCTTFTVVDRPGIGSPGFGSPGA